MRDTGYFISFIEQRGDRIRRRIEQLQKFYEIDGLLYERFEHFELGHDPKRAQFFSKTGTFPPAKTGRQHKQGS